jgi:FAD/FMN-containing dehydrogenase
MRSLTLGLEVVGANGAVWDGLRGLRKDNTGYALRDLFIGSEGTLGIITKATIQLFPLPAAQCTAMVAIASIEEALQLLKLVKRALALLSLALKSCLIKLFKWLNKPLLTNTSPLAIPVKQPHGLA